MSDQFNDFASGQTRREPVRPPTQPMFNLPGVITVLLGILFVVQALISLIAFTMPQSEIPNYIYFYGGFIPLRYSFVGTSSDISWLWTPLTYSFLHGGWEHLIFNGIWLAIFGAPVARRIGTVRVAIFWIVISVLSAAAYYVFNAQSEALMVGASGVISGFTGAACRFVWSPRMGAGATGRAGNSPLLSISGALTNRTVLSFAIVWLLANVVIAALGGFSSVAIAWEAHLGGFLAGFLLFPLFDRGSGQRA